MTARLRCCGRWCYWRPPFGPWACTRCERRYYGRPMPRNAHARFDDAVEALVRRLGAAPPRPDLMGLFFKPGPGR